MHRRTNSKSNHVVSTHSRRLHITILPILSIATSLGLSALLPSPSTYAAGEPSKLEIIVPSIPNQGSASLSPRAISSAFSSYYLPVGVKASGISKAELFVTSDSNAASLGGAVTTDLVGTTTDTNGERANRIPTLSRGNITKEEFRANVDLNNRWGYRATLVAANDDFLEFDNSTTNQTKLNTLTTNSVINTDGNKTWGNIIADTGELGRATFYPVSSHLNAEPIHTMNANATGGNFTGLFALEFAAKVDGNTPNDTYEGYIVVSAIATPRETIFDLEYMQDISSEACDNTTTPSKDATASNANKTATYTPEQDGNPGSWNVSPVTNFTEQAGNTTYVPETVLLDKRDDKPYLVRKLADGNCWMSSNLAYDFIANDNAQLIDAELTDIQDEWRSVNIRATQSDTNISWTGTSYGTGFHSFSWQLYNDGAMAFSRQNQDGSFEDASAGSLTEYRGNLYNWQAATINSVQNLDDGNIATSSVCPSGWRLPNYSGLQSFYNLFTDLYAYDLNDEQLRLQVLSNFPLNFNRTGYYVSSGSLKNPLTNGRWWSNAVSGNGSAYGLNHYGSAVNDMNSLGMNHGASIRCVAR